MGEPDQYCVLSAAPKKCLLYNLCRMDQADVVWKPWVQCNKVKSEDIYWQQKFFHKEMQVTN